MTSIHAALLFANLPVFPFLFKQCFVFTSFPMTFPFFLNDDNRGIINGRISFPLRMNLASSVAAPPLGCQFPLFFPVIHRVAIRFCQQHISYFSPSFNTILPPQPLLFLVLVSQVSISFHPLKTFSFSPISTRNPQTPSNAIKTSPYHTSLNTFESADARDVGIMTLLGD